MSDSRDSLAQLRQALRALEPAPIAKAVPRLPKSAENEPARLRFVAAVDALGALTPKWSWERIAKYLGVATTTVIAVYKGERYVTAWMLDRLEEIPELERLPTKERIEQLAKVG